MRLEKWDSRFLRLAREVSTWSKDPSTQTGAVLVRDKIILGVGFNGFPRTMRDDPEIYADREQKYSRIVHCEVNALIFANGPVRGATLYTWPFMCCDRCVVQMLQAGVIRFYAPVAPSDQASRWEATFVKTRAYIEEAGAFLFEIPREWLEDAKQQVVMVGQGGFGHTTPGCADELTAKQESFAADARFDPDQEAAKRKLRDELLKDQDEAVEPRDFTSRR